MHQDKLKLKYFHIEMKRALMRSVTKLVIAMGFLTATNMTVAEESTLDLVVNVQGVEANVGQVFTSLFDAEETYLNEPVDVVVTPVKDLD